MNASATIVLVIVCSIAMTALIAVLCNRAGLFKPADHDRNYYSMTYDQKQYMSEVHKINMRDVEAGVQPEFGSSISSNSSLPSKPGSAYWPGVREQEVV